MIDTHCHLDLEAFAADRAAVLERARAAGVTEVIVPATGPDRWEPLLAFAARTAGVHAGLGIHPQRLPELPAADDDRHLARLESLLARGAAVAVGECGLDAPSAAGAPLDRQTAVLREHLRLARRFDLPVLVHCLRAHDALLALFEREPPPPCVLHSFSGSAEQARLFAEWDVYVSFAGPLTYENARKPLAAARAVAPDRLVIETDAPDQTPRPYRGRCEPAYLVRIAEGLAAALGTTPAEVERLTERNARALFRLPAFRR